MGSSITDTIAPTQIDRNVKIKSRNFLINLLLLVVSIAFAVVLCEFALRLMGHTPLFVSPERNRFWRYDSLLGWAHQPGQEGIFETPQFRTFVRINQKGLRDSEHPYDRLDSSGRILVLGDSFAWGYGVEESERFSELLETSLSAEVINAGVSGYSTDQELLWFRDEGIKYDIDLVIVMLTGNDIGDNTRQLVHTIYYKPQFVQERGQLALIGYPVRKTSLLGRFIYFLSQRSALAFFLTQQYFDLRDWYAEFRADSDNTPATPFSIDTEGESFALSVALLDEIGKLADSKGAELMIVATERWWNNPSEETYEDLIEKLHTKGFLVLDVESTAGFQPGKMVIPDDGHWSRAGHEFVAEKIKGFIEYHQLLLPQQD